jgi:heme-degrading monooxygenase HmoA
MVSVMTRAGLAPSLGFMHALVVVHGLRGIDAAAHAELADQLAPALDAVPGLVSRTRLENSASGRYGAFYLFESKAAFDRFVASELYGAAHAHAAVVAVAASDFAIPNGRGKTA